VLISGSVSFPQEGQSVIYPGQLSGLTYLLLIGLVGALDDGLPDISGKRLVRICRIRELAVYPFFCYFLISIDSVIYIPCAFCQGLIGLFDFLRSSVGFVVGIAV